MKASLSEKVSLENKLSALRRETEQEEQRVAEGATLRETHGKAD